MIEWATWFMISRASFRLLLPMVPTFSWLLPLGIHYRSHTQNTQYTNFLYTQEFQYTMVEHVGVTCNHNITPSSSLNTHSFVQTLSISLPFVVLIGSLSSIADFEHRSDQIAFRMLPQLNFLKKLFTCQFCFLFFFFPRSGYSLTNCWPFFFLWVLYFFPQVLVLCLN